jgi:hypothetical protein
VTGQAASHSCESADRPFSSDTVRGALDRLEGRNGDKCVYLESTRIERVVVTGVVGVCDEGKTGASRQLRCVSAVRSDSERTS